MSIVQTGPPPNPPNAPLPPIRENSDPEYGGGRYSWFADQIAVVRGGTTVDTIALPQPAAVEYARGMLYASTDVFGNGAVVTISP